MLISSSVETARKRYTSHIKSLVDCLAYQKYLLFDCFKFGKLLNFDMERSSISKRYVPLTKHVLHWFRKGLRLHDNPALRDSLEGAATVRCIYILDPWFAGSSQVAVGKWRFLLQCLEDLDESLRKLGSCLFVIRGQPADVLPRYFKEWKTTTLSFEKDPEPFGKDRDSAICALAREAGVEVITRGSHTLYDLQKIISLNNGKAPLTFKCFQKVIQQIGLPPRPEETITERDLGISMTPIPEDYDTSFSIPTLEELGFDTDDLPSSVFQGGETDALVRLGRHLERKAWVASFEKPKLMSDALFPSKTGLSPYLRFGCLSARLFYWKLLELYKKVKKDNDPPLSLHGQLLWREFFYTVATNNPRFDCMKNNPGKTGFPWIDAIMTQLHREGWIHHLARHAVACFLTRGDLWVSWEEGMKVFDELMLDADWSVSAGSWMWMSCSSFFQRFFSSYCPVGLGRKVDPNGEFIRHYLPVFKDFPSRYIHEPWTAPMSVQKAARCIVGVNYPVPMVNHTEVARINTERMKQVYAQFTKQCSAVLHNKIIPLTSLHNSQQFRGSKILSPELFKPRIIQEFANDENSNKN